MPSNRLAVIMGKLMPRRSLMAAALAAASTCLVGCERATGPRVIESGTPVSLEMAYVLTLVGADAIPTYMLTIRSTFVNVQNTTVYVHQWCDDPSGGDTTYHPWLTLARDSADDSRIAYQFGGCYLMASQAAPPHAVAPWDSLTSEVRFPALLGHVPTAADSAALTGRMRVDYMVTWTAAPLTSPAQLIPLSLRSSSSFSVALQ